MNKVPVRELEKRMQRFKQEMNSHDPDWEMAVIFTNINLYYLTGTMQDGILIIPSDAEATLWVRRSYKRAKLESMFQDIRPMQSFRDAATTLEDLPTQVYLEMDNLPLALYQRLEKHFPFQEVIALDPVINKVRTVKSDYELALMEKSGKIHEKVLEEMVPLLLNEGISEAQLTADIFKALIQEGHHGVTRFGMFDAQIVLGQVCFGESSNYPSYLNSPGGNLGSPAVPLFGSHVRKLKKGDLVFVDVGCGVEGYHTDKTMTYIFAEQLTPEVVDAHQKCVNIQAEVANQLKPGSVPAEIYKDVMDDLDSDFIKNFMGFEDNQVKFLGHGIGLMVDELPVIAPGFHEPLVENMVFAIEPKKGIKGVGMVGIENTFIVTKTGGKSITGYNPGLIPVY